MEQRLPPRRPLDDDEDDRLQQYERLADLFEEGDAEDADDDQESDEVEEDAAADEEE